jgi:hypothetical protein
MQPHLAIQPFLEPSLLSHGYETADIAVLVDCIWETTIEEEIEKLVWFSSSHFFV